MLFLFGLRIEMADGLQPLKEAFYLSLVIGTKQLVLGGWKLPAFHARWQYLAPKLLVRDTVDESFARAAAEVTKEALSGIDIAGINKHNAVIAGQSEMYDEGRYPRGPVQPPDFRPWNNPAPYSQVVLVNLDSGLQR
jgi:hypothetical protein